MTTLDTFTQSDTDANFVRFGKRWRRSIVLGLAAIVILAGASAWFASRRLADPPFRVLYQAQVLADGEVLAFTSLESPQFDPLPSVGFFALGPPMHPLMPRNTSGLSVFLDSPDDADFTLVASGRDQGTRDEALAIERVDIQGRSTSYGGGVPVGGLTFVPPDLLAVSCRIDLVAMQGNGTTRFYQLRDGHIVPIGKFTHPESGCNVRKTLSIGTGQIVLFAQLESNSQDRFEIITYDIAKDEILARAASTIDGETGSQLAVDASRTHVAVANLEQVELRRLPDLMLVSNFARPAGANECLAVSNEGRYVAMGGQGTWVWSFSEGVCRQLHPGSQEPKLSLKSRGAHGDHLDHGAFLHNYMMHSRQRIKFVGFLGNAVHLVDVTGDGVVAKWDLEKSQLIETRRLWD